VSDIELGEPDLETAVMEMLRQRFPILATPAGGLLRVATETPDDLPTRVTSSAPFVRVTDIGGAGGRLDVGATVDVDVYGRSRNQTRDLAVAIEGFMLSAPHSVFVGGAFVLVDSVGLSVRPHRVPWPDETIRRYYSSYQLSARR